MSKFKKALSDQQEGLKENCAARGRTAPPGKFIRRARRDAL